jgi:hypothetical protein
MLCSKRRRQRCAPGRKGKREAFRNAVLDATSPGAPEVAEQQIFVGLIDTFTDWHVQRSSLAASYGSGSFVGCFLSRSTPHFSSGAGLRQPKHRTTLPPTRTTPAVNPQCGHFTFDCGGKDMFGSPSSRKAGRFVVWCMRSRR